MTEFIMTPARVYKPARKINKIKINTGDDMNRQQLHDTKKLHRNAIKGLRQDIRKHRLLIKQAKLTYKLMKGTR